MTNQKHLPDIPTARLLLDAFRAFENDLAEILTHKGFNDVTPGNFNVMRHLNPEGMHMSELAKDAQISKQALGKMIKDVEQKGYVEIVPDPSDARAKYVRFTTRGKKLIDLAIKVVADIEMQYQSMLGKHNYNKLRQSVEHILLWHQNKEQN